MQDTHALRENAVCDCYGRCRLTAGLEALRSGSAGCSACEGVSVHRRMKQITSHIEPHMLDLRFSRQ